MAHIGVSTAAQQLDVSEQTIRNWIKRGLITGYRVGPHMLRVDQDELSALIQEVA